MEKKFAITGSRNLDKKSETGKRFAQFLAENLEAEIFVGDAMGADKIARDLFPSARVFRVRSGGSKWRYAARSIEMVKESAKAGCRVLLAALLVPCPEKLIPSKNPSKCFCGHGSGTWGTIAYAQAMGFRIILIAPEGIAKPDSWNEETKPNCLEL